MKFVSKQVICHEYSLTWTSQLWSYSNDFLMYDLNTWHWIVDDHRLRHILLVVCYRHIRCSSLFTYVDRTNKKKKITTNDIEIYIRCILSDSINNSMSKHAQSILIIILYESTVNLEISVLFNGIDAYHLL
jgi:hypothetical protein